MLEKLNFKLLGKILLAEHILLILVLAIAASISGYVWMYVGMWLSMNFVMGIVFCFNVKTILDEYSKLSYALHYIAPFLLVGLPVVLIVMMIELVAVLFRDLPGRKLVQ